MISATVFSVLVDPGRLGETFAPEQYGRVRRLESSRHCDKPQVLGQITRCLELSSRVDNGATLSGLL